MGLQLIESSFQPSTIPGAVIFQCKWEYIVKDAPGIICYSSALVEPDMILTVNFWNDMIAQVGQWHIHHRRKHGECYELHGH